MPCPDRIIRLRAVLTRRVRCLLSLAAVAAAVATWTPAAAGFEVAAASDIACPPGARSGEREGWETISEEFKCRGRDVANLIAGQDPRFTIAAGDIVHGANARRSAYRAFDHNWAPLRGSIMPTPGNHDRKREAGGGWNFNGYYGYWYARGLSPSRIGRPNRSWASYDVGHWHMVTLNSNCNTVNCTLTGPQVRWLLRDLKRDRENPETKCVLAYMHHPRFSSGVPRGRTGDRMLVSNLWEVLYRYRTDIVVTGHQHYYERYRPLNPSGRPDRTGIVQYITGTGGAVARTPFGASGVAAPGARASIRSLGATFFELGDRSYTSYFRTIRDKPRDRVSTPVKCLGDHVGSDRRKRRTARFLARVKRLKRLARQKRSAVRRVRKLRRKRTRLERNAGYGYSSRLLSNQGRLAEAGADLARIRAAHSRLLAKPLYP